MTASLCITFALIQKAIYRPPTYFYETFALHQCAILQCVSWSPSCQHLLHSQVQSRMCTTANRQSLRVQLPMERRNLLINSSIANTHLARGRYGFVLPRTCPAVMTSYSPCSLSCGKKGRFRHTTRTSRARDVHSRVPPSRSRVGTSLFVSLYCLRNLHSTVQGHSRSDLDVYAEHVSRHFSALWAESGACCMMSVLPSLVAPCTYDKMPPCNADGI